MRKPLSSVNLLAKFDWIGCQVAEPVCTMHNAHALYSVECMVRTLCTLQACNLACVFDILKSLKVLLWKVFSHSIAVNCRAAVIVQASCKCRAWSLPVQVIVKYRRAYFTITCTPVTISIPAPPIVNCKVSQGIRIRGHKALPHAHYNHRAT